MYKKFILVISIMLLATSAFAVDFAPTVMELDVSPIVYYDFDGSNIDIPLNIAGKAGTFYLVISTQGEAENINMVRNGKLGWHTVNKIDTTISVTGPYIRETGDVTIPWNGTDADGGIVSPGTYTYSIWGYDHINDRIPVTKYICAEYGWKTHFTGILQVGEDGLPLANPIIYGSMHHQNVKDDIDYLKHGTQKKWIIGGDPNDRNLLQITYCDIYPPVSERGNVGWLSHGISVYDPTDYDIFYHCMTNNDTFTSTMLKWAFVNDGNAILDGNWGGFDNITWTDESSMGVWLVPHQCVMKDNLIFVQAADQVGTAPGDYNWLRCVDLEGEQVFDKQMMEFFMPDDENTTGAQNCAMLDFDAGPAPYQLFMGTMGCCMHEMINAANLVMEGDVDEEDYLRWRNANGDFFLDVMWEQDAPAPWTCLNNSEYSSHRIDSVATDSNDFNFLWTTYTGMYSFGASCPDGTQIGMIHLADDASFESTKNRGGGHLVDSGSQYDGIYMVRANQEGQTNGWAEPETHWTAYDSAKGTITSEVGVEEDAQTAFAVAQNSPNPFNPTTSIGFTIPETGNVTVEVFNIAGQKVDTLVDDVLNAGQHSITWDASSFSNGVYFYTVEVGELSKTMKMTLLK